MNLPLVFSLPKLKFDFLTLLKEKKAKFLPVVNFLLMLAFLLVGALVVKTKPLPDIRIKPILGFRELLPTPAPYPVYQKISSPPELSAVSVIALDGDSMATLYEKNTDQPLFPASTTKIMTALIALENYRLDQVLTVGKIKIDGNAIKLVPGEQITVESLLYGLLVGSGNDAALVLAENFPGGTAGFVAAMNKKAEDLKLTNTHFTNPIGLDEKTHYSTAKDLARLTLVAVKDPEFSRIVSTPGLVINDVSGKITHFLKNTNELVGKLEGVKGVKTGWTANAGECLITLTERNGRKVVTVILGSKDRFGETQKLIAWIFENFRWEIIAPAKAR